jgi:hypothetical protein
MLLAWKSTLVRDSQPIWGVVPKDLHPCSFQVDRVSQHAGGYHQVKAARAIAPALEAPVADFAKPVQEHGASQRALRLTLV